MWFRIKVGEAFKDVHPLAKVFKGHFFDAIKVADEKIPNLKKV